MHVLCLNCGESPKKGWSTVVRGSFSAIVSVIGRTSPLSAEQPVRQTTFAKASVVRLSFSEGGSRTLRRRHERVRLRRSFVNQR